MSQLTRPSPARWVWYAFGGSLPDQCATWVFHDTTCSTWVLRQVARSFVQLAVPIALALVLLPVPLNARILTVVVAGLPAMLFQLLYIHPNLEHRLVKAGYPAGIGDTTRTQRATNAQIDGNRQRRERAAARKAARAARRVTI